MVNEYPSDKESPYLEFGILIYDNCFGLGFVYYKLVGDNFRAWLVDSMIICLWRNI